MEYEEIELANGVLGFEGNVLDVFGFATPGGSARVPVSQITQLSWNKDILTVRCQGNVPTQSLVFKKEEVESQDLTDFLELVRGNALNLEDY